MQGTRLGPHEIESKLGEGGMGEVYLATDTRLGRSVALKILPAEFSTDIDRLARFEREARAAAALNHPNIAAVFDIGVEGDVRYIVQEYLEGEDLRARLGAGKLPLKTALALAASVAEALAVAHDAGIAHRDLKPENIFVTSKGHAKILDFGLAKLTETKAAKDNSATQSPTVLATSAGQIMGTAGYMAPEQIAGEEIDGRADLFAFGCVLYEVVTGQRAFTGKNLPEVLHRLANEPAPSLAESDPALPAELSRIVAKCLEKDTAHRYQGAADLAVDLRALVSQVEAGTAGSSGAVAAPATGSPMGMVAAGIAGLALGALGWWLLGGGAGAPGEIEPTHLPLREVAGLSNDNFDQVAVSPDSRYIAFATGAGSLQLWDLMTSDDPTEVEGTLYATAPFFSPDGHWLGFVGADNRLHRVPVAGGRPQPFTEPIEIEIVGVDWYESGEFILRTAFEQPVLHLPAIGESVVSLLETDRDVGEAGLGPASFLPDGDRILYSYWDDRWRVGVRSRTSGERTELTQGYGASYVPSGHLVWVLSQQLMAATLDLATLELGEPVQLLNTVGATPSWGRPGYDLSRDGTLLFLEAAPDRAMAIRRLYPDGRTELIRAGDRELLELSISPNGRRLGMAALTVDGDSQIWSYDLARNDIVPIGQGAGWDQYPFFFDNDTIGYVSERDEGRGDLYRRAADGSGPEIQLSSTLPYRNNPHADRSGRVVARVSSPETNSDDIWVFEPGNWDTGIRVVTTGGIDANPKFSADGSFITFASNRSGRYEVYVVPYPRGEQDVDWKVTTDGGRDPQWSPDGRAIFYISDGMIYRTEVTGTQPFRTARPEPFLGYLGDTRNWTVSSDGTHIIAADALEPPRPRVIFNLHEELERRLPTR